MAGHLENGNWVTEKEFADDDGAYKRQQTSFRNWIGQPDGAPDTDSDRQIFPAEKDRYHLYVSYACPWAHRTLILRRLKQLENLISVSVVHPHMLENGWSLSDDFDGSTGDTLYGLDFLHQLYTKAMPDYTGKVTVPVLWDKKDQTIVNNESAEIIRIFNTAFNDITGNNEDYYPADLREEIGKINDNVYDNVNNGVYKTGFATKQDVYEKNFRALFATLDDLEERLEGKDFLVGDRLTEADIRLLTTLLRFDAVYYVHFKCNQRRIADYPNLSAYMQKLANMEAVKPTLHFDHIKHHYYYSHQNLNPHGIVPLGPDTLP